MVPLSKGPFFLGLFLSDQWPVSLHSFFLFPRPLKLPNTIHTHATGVVFYDEGGGLWSGTEFLWPFIRFFPFPKYTYIFFHFFRVGCGEYRTSLGAATDISQDDSIEMRVKRNRAHDTFFHYYYLFFFSYGNSHVWVMTAARGGEFGDPVWGAVISFLQGKEEKRYCRRRCHSLSSLPRKSWQTVADDEQLSEIGFFPLSFSTRLVRVFEVSNSAKFQDDVSKTSG